MYFYYKVTDTTILHPKVKTTYIRNSIKIMFENLYKKIVLFG